MTNKSKGKNKNQSGFHNVASNDSVVTVRFEEPSLKTGTDPVSET
jgi:hypothetical protein